MAPAVVQGVQASAFSATLSSTGTGNCLYVVLIANNGGSSQSITGVTIGGLASNFSQVFSAQDPTNSQVSIFIWQCPSAPSGKTALVVTPSASLNNPYLEVYEVSGMGSTPSLDVSSIGPYKAGTTTWKSNFTTTSTGTDDFIIGACGTGPYSGGDVLTGPGGSWVNASSVAWAGGASIVGYEIVGSAGTFHYTGTSLNYDYYVAIVACFIPGTGTTSTGAISMGTPYFYGVGGAAGNRGILQMQAPKIAGTVQVTALTFPQEILGLQFEMLLGGVWVDVTQYVYQRDNITVSRGETDETQQITPGAVTFTLNNQNGNFSPKNPQGIFYPYITRNVQFRINIQAYSADLEYYNGYRFWGEVSEWPPQWDQTGNDVFVQVQCGGVLRRYVQGKNLGSAIKRYYMLYVKNQSAFAPASYWPMEDGSGSSFFQSAIVPGETLAWTGGPPTLASDATCLGSDPLPLMANAVISGTCQGYGNAGPALFNSPGTFEWVCPGGITSLTDVEAWGPAGGGANGYSGNSGAGGEYAKDTAVGVTPGNIYLVVVGSGGAGGGLSDTDYYPGQPGSGVSSFQADSVLTQAGWGTGGLLHSAGFCQTESTSATHHPGGAGALGANGGAGGGSSGGSGSAGNPGNAGGATNGGAGGNAVTGGAAGGHGGGEPEDNGLTNGGNPGGGGGGGSFDTKTGAYHSGSQGGNGQVKLTYGSATVPNNIVLRFVIDVPTATTLVTGGVIIHLAFSSGGLGYIDCYYGKGGQLGFRGYNTSSVKVFDSGLSTFNVEGNGPMMISMELAKSGTGIAWTISNITQGNTSLNHTYTGTLASTAMGNATTVTIAQSGNVNDWTIGHVVLQYALEPLTNLGPVLAGHNGETAKARFVRLSIEEGFGYSVTDNIVDSTPAWSYTASGTPVTDSYFIVTTAQSAAIAVGQQFTDNFNGGILFTVTSLSAPSGGFVNVFFTPSASFTMSSGDVISQVDNTPQMGPQTDQTFTELLQEIQDVDQGMVYEPRGFFGLSYITREAMYNQNPVLTLDYNAAEFGYPLAPGYDDQLIRNDVTVSRVNGSSVIQVDNTDTMSINAPPNGVGDYPYTLQANTYNDTQIQNLCLWILTKGTVDEYRYPVVLVDMTRNETAANFSNAANLDIGQMWQGINMPSFLPSYTIQQLAWGFQETLNAFMWTIAINAVPESPYSGSGLPTW
jgi:hypothetical protein